MGTPCGQLIQERHQNFNGYTSETTDNAKTVSIATTVTKRSSDRHLTGDDRKHYGPFAINFSAPPPHTGWSSIRWKSLNGVPLRNGVSSIYADMIAALPWLHPAHQDDRLLATVLQIATRYLRRPVALVTRDINLQNKAEFCRVRLLRATKGMRP